jgi:hypothetical protein
MFCCYNRSCCNRSCCNRICCNRSCCNRSNCKKLSIEPFDDKRDNTSNNTSTNISRYSLDNDEHIILIIDKYYIISSMIQNNYLKYKDIQDYDGIYYSVFKYICGTNIYINRIAFTYESVCSKNFTVDIANSHIRNINNHNIATKNITNAMVLDFFNYVITTKITKNAILAIDKMKNIIIKEWSNKKYIIKNYFTQILGIPFPNNEYLIYLTLPQLKIAASLHENYIIFGMNKLNECVPLIIHELLHSIFPRDDNIAHAIIELAADYGMSSILYGYNSGHNDSDDTSPASSATVSLTQSPTGSPTLAAQSHGHFHLNLIRTTIIPHWNNYVLAKEAGNTDWSIITFYNDMKLL